MAKWGASLTLADHRPAGAWRLAIAAWVVLCVGQAAPAGASPIEKPLPPLPVYGAPRTAPAATPPPNDLLGSGFYLEANELIDDEQHHTVTARGQVEARYQGRVLRAERVDYNGDTGIVTATGDVVIVNADGTAEFSQSATLDRQLSTGVALAFSSRLQQNVTIAASRVERQSQTRTELDQAIFTPCPVCANSPTPTWSIRASKVIEDKKRQIVSFRNAVIEVRGVPILYAPVLWIADPAVKRKSGFLIPEISASSLRGLSWEQPYLQVISPSEDLVVSPQFNTKVNPFLNVDWRRRFYSGAIDVRGGYTYEQDFDSHGDKLGNATSRSYVLAKGLFAIDNAWDWGFTAERTSDPLIFDRYGVADPFIDRGLYAADDRRLISQLFTTRQDADSYASAAAIDVQGLRSTDLNATFPIIAPLIEAHYAPSQPIFGGRLRIDGGGVVLTRDDSPADPLLPGVDSRRGTIEASWQRSVFLPIGLRLDPFLDVRGDVYSLADLAAPFAKSATIVRGFSTAGVTASWPFFKRQGQLTYILEPVAQVVISPNYKQDPRIPNEDSIDFEFDDTNLFQPNKSPGFDLVDSGQRFNLGGRASVETDAGQSASLLVGRSFRAKADPNLPPRAGLSGQSSDWVFAGDAAPLKGVSLFTRLRLDAQTEVINRLEAGADFATSRFSGQVRYLQEAQDPTGHPVKDLDFHAELYVLKHWGVTAYGAREFTSGVWREQDFGVVYRDDCIRVEVVYRRSNTFNGVLGPSSGVGLRLSLATLGNSGYGRTANPPSLVEAPATSP